MLAYIVQDGANVPQSEQDRIMNEAKSNLAAYSDKLVWLRNFTNEAVSLIKEPLDYVYVDARHDYCGCYDDMEMYWPLLKPGGIMAGHDYETGASIKALLPNEDWGLCGNGSRNEGAVVSAVNDFFKRLGLTVTVTYREGQWNSWMVRKPLKPSE